MNTRGIIGRRIVRIDQQRYYNDQLKCFQHNVDRIVLDDGTVLTPIVAELVTDYGVDLVVHNRPTRARKPR